MIFSKIRKENLVCWQVSVGTIAIYVWNVGSTFVEKSWFMELPVELYGDLLFGKPLLLSHAIRDYHSGHSCQKVGGYGGCQRKDD